MTRRLRLVGGWGLAAIILTCSLGTAGQAQAAGRIVDCRVESAGKIEFAGKCRFTPDGRAGSFSLGASRGQGPLYGSILIVSVSIVSRGVAEVRGLTRQGINSRWGQARRSTRDRACWVGSDFRICAW